jgi:hypothetical protein
MSRLHCITPWQGGKPSVLSEVALRAVKRRLASSFAIFFAKKMAAGKSLTPPAILKRFLRRKTQNFAVK